MRRIRHRYGHSLSGTLCGEYHTRTGKVGAKIFRHTDRDGRVTYSFRGEWDAGSGHGIEYMKKLVAGWHERKRGMRVIVPFHG